MFRVRRWVIHRAAFFAKIYGFLERGILFCAPIIKKIGLKRANRIFVWFEKPTKSFLFDCTMCGDCLLGSTGMSCPMNCPKQVRNGPCGGVRNDGNCEVKPEMPCVWVDGWQGISKTEQYNRYLTPRRAAESLRKGKSAWVEVINHQTIGRPDAKIIDPENLPKERTSPYPPNTLEKLLTEGSFAVTAELSPPDSAYPEDIANRARHFEGLVDAVNVPDGSGANCHMSSLASSLILRELGFTPVMQFACRDRNRIALQGDILGAAALGIKNLLCLTGDDVGGGDQPGAKPVFDLDSVSLLRTARTMRDQSHFLSGRPITTQPDLFLGGALNPFMPPYEARPYRLAKKIAAGAQFVQTQYCYDIELLNSFMDEVRRLKLHKRCHILIGVGPMVSAKSANWIRNNVPGINIPDTIISRMQDSKNEKQEGKKICIELIEQIREIKGISGVHIMAHKQEQLLAEIVRETGLDKK